MVVFNFENSDTLSARVNELTRNGFDESFKAMDNYVIALFSKTTYLPDELRIIEIFRFDGMTDPDDETILFAIIANDGTKGTLVMSYSAENDQNLDLIKEIPYRK